MFLCVHIVLQVCSVFTKFQFVFTSILTCDFVEKISNDNFVEIDAPMKVGVKKVIENQIAMFSM